MLFRSVRVIPLVAVLISGAFIAILSQTLLSTALPPIMKDLHLSANTAQWLTSAVLLTVGIMVPITAFLIGKFTTRQLFLAAMGSFACGTLLSAMAPNFELLLTGRIFQAAGAGVMIPLMQTVLFVIFPPEKRGTIMGIFGLIITLAPAVGPTIAGWVVDHYSWRILFWMIVPISVLDLFCAYLFLRNITERTDPKVDAASLLLSSVGFGGVLYGFSAAGSIGWTGDRVLFAMFIGAVSLALFIRRQFRLARPILEFRVFRYGTFAISTGILMIVYMHMIGGSTILPIYMQDMLGFSATDSGLMLLPGALVMGAMSFVSGRLFDKLGASGARWLAIAGRI